MVRAAIPLAALTLAGCCTTPEPVVVTEQVKVQIPEMPEAPPELESDYNRPALPRFVPPGHDQAKAALTKDGVQRLQQIIDSMESRREAWRAWYMGNQQE